MKKIITLILISLLIPFLMASYNYSFYGEVLHSSAGYNYIGHFNQQSIGVEYDSPQALKVFGDKIYLLAKNKDLTKDIIIVLDHDFNLIASYEKFDLTENYQIKVLEEVDATFNLIEEMYREMLEKDPVYSGITLPIDNIKNIISTINSSWTTENSSIITTTGYVNNKTNEIVTSKLGLEVSLLGKVANFEFNVRINPFVNGIIAESKGFAYNVDENVETVVLNGSILSNFEIEKYETIKDIIDDNRLEEETEFIYENYHFEFTDSPYEDATYDDIVITLIIDEEDSVTPSELHGSMFDSHYTTNRAQGFEVVESGIYLADTENGRIVKLNHDFEVVNAFYGVNDETFVEHVYKPLKITVDTSERMYVIASGVYEGIIELDKDGDFNRYTGVNPIKLSPYEIFKRTLMTEVQKEKLQKFLPTDYTSLVMDEKNFIFATAKPRENNSDDIIQLINPKGIDVLKRNGYHIPKGDIMYVTSKNNYVIEGPSDLVDIAIGKDGIYSVLDNKRSRIFTYDREGNLLYVNGDKGEQSDKFNRGISLEYLNNNILVLDDSGTIIVYRPTEFGEAVNKAIEYHSKGMFEEAALEWEKVLKLNTNYEVAYNGIGMYHLREKNFKEAMKNFKLGHDQYYYSKAFKEYRNQLIKDNFIYFVLGLIIIVSGFGAFKIYKKVKRGDN